jgi:hypothetical protein
LWDVAPSDVNRDVLAGAAQTALGGGRRLDSVQRLAGGSRKGVYRLAMDDATTAIAYLWVDSENYWPAAEGDGDLADPDHNYCSGDLAIVADFPGEHLMDRLARDPQAAEPTMARLAEALEAMRCYRAPSYGKVALIDRGGTSRGTSCAGAALALALPRRGRLA